jgi:hypothetical protein
LSFFTVLAFDLLENRSVAIRFLGADAGDIDARTDIWSLGLTLVELQGKPQLVVQRARQFIMS